METNLCFILNRGYHCSHCYGHRQDSTEARVIRNSRAHLYSFEGAQWQQLQDCLCIVSSRLYHILAHVESDSVHKSESLFFILTSLPIVLGDLAFFRVVLALV